MDEAEIQRQFGALLAELPETPRHFNLYFREATSDLTEESRAILPDILTAVKARKVPEVTVIGHTDTTGSTASNYQLGLERAQAVRALLLKAGLDASLVDVESHGEGGSSAKARPTTPTSPATAVSRSRSGDERGRGRHLSRSRREPALRAALRPGPGAHHRGAGHLPA